MPIPSFQTLMLPVLKDLLQGERSGRETVEALANLFELTPREIAERLQAEHRQDLRIALLGPSRT